MRRMVFDVARRCRTLSTAALDPISRKSLGVQTPVELIRSRICALRSSAGPRCGLGVCPIFVVTFRTDLMASACPKNVYIVRTNQNNNMSAPNQSHRAWTKDIYLEGQVGSCGRPLQIWVQN